MWERRIIRNCSVESKLGAGFRIACTENIEYLNCLKSAMGVPDGNQVMEWKKVRIRKGIHLAMLWTNVGDLRWLNFLARRSIVAVPSPLIEPSQKSRASPGNLPSLSCFLTVRSIEPDRFVIGILSAIGFQRRCLHKRSTRQSLRSATGAPLKSPRRISTRSFSRIGFSEVFPVFNCHGPVSFRSL
jgi:hypothetical protein